jgi:hypothetical protein
VHDFALAEHDALQILSEWNATCSPPWSPRELEHKINQAATKPHNTPRGAKLDIQRATVSATGRFIVSRTAAPPTEQQTGGANRADAVALLKAAFDPEEPHGSSTKSRAETIPSPRPPPVAAGSELTPTNKGRPREQTKMSPRIATS